MAKPVLRGPAAGFVPVNSAAPAIAKGRAGSSTRTGTPAALVAVAPEASATVSLGVNRPRWP